jgi:PAS domain S-box-containing protein
MPVKVYELLQKTKFQIIATCTLIGTVIPVIAWILEFTTDAISFGLKGTATIHINNPSLFFIDLIPFVVGYFTYYLLNWIDDLKHKNQLSIEERDRIIARNAEFAKHIGKGDYTTPFDIPEDDALGKSLLIMRDNLLQNTQKEAEQSWIADGKEQISAILRNYNKIDILSYEVIVSLIKYSNAVQGAIYLYDEERRVLSNITTYAYNRKKYINQEFRIGQGLIGQCAYEMDIIYRTEIPDEYVTITSGILGDKKPRSILILPLISDDKLMGVMEFAFLLEEIPELTIQFLKELGEIIARTIFNLGVNQKTERLLEESRQMTYELQENEEQLRQSAEEMRATQEELQKSNEKLEGQVHEVENAQKRLHSLLENASEIILIYSEKIELKYISPSVNSILGFTPDEMMKGKDMDRLTRKGEAEMKNMFNLLLQNANDALTIQYTYLKKDGQKVFLETTGRNLISDKAINGIILNTRDVTERKRAEKEERMKSKMQALSENSLDLIMRLSMHGMFFYSNPIVEDYMGFKNTDLLNKTINDIVLDESLKEYFSTTLVEMKKAPSKRNNTITIPLQVGEKTVERIISFDAIPEFNENELETVLFVGHDITEAKRIELEIQDKNRKIEDSINYAQRIQSAILPDNSYIRDYLPQSFILYKPRDVVSGDFPWFFLHNETIYIAAVDCTGHGVPGALLSFIGYFILNNIVDHDREYTASEVCDLLHNGVRTTLKQNRDDAQGRDGMDIALCRINYKKKELQYAGAHRPLYFLRGNELTEYKGDRKAIGGIPLGNKPENNFTNYVIPFEKGDKVFFFSDGLPDQLGGPADKKYSPARIREQIVNNNSFNMQQYQDLFEKDYWDWKGTNKQIDDVLLIGIEF